MLSGPHRNDMKSQSTNEIATKIASVSVEKRVEIATETAVIQIAAISNPASRLDH